MHMYRLEGTHRQVGAEYGFLLQSSRFALPPSKPTQIKFALKCEKLVRQHAPELLEELDGMIEGSSYNADHLKALALTLNVPAACTVVAISGQHTADGRPLFARNLDWYFWYARCAALIGVKIPGEFASLGGNDLFIGRHDGLNEAGLAIGITDVSGGRHMPGIMFPLAVRHILNTCTTAEAAVAFLEKIPFVRNNNFLVADAAGTIATVEASSKRVNVTYASNGFAVITNHFLSERMALLENTKYRPPDSMQRFLRMQAWFRDRSEPITASALQTIMSRPYPSGVWSLFKPGKRAILGTVWSWVAALGERQMAFAEGTPQGCMGYKCYEF